MACVRIVCVCMYDVCGDICFYVCICMIYVWYLYIICDMCVGIRVHEVWGICVECVYVAVCV